MRFLDPEHPGEEYTNLGLDVIIDHIVNLTDVNIVAIGSDYDGTSVPNCVRDCTKLPDLWDYLLENGYTEQDINKNSYENLI